MSSMVDRLHELVAPVLTDLDLDLYDLEWAGGVVRVVVDRPGGVDLEAIAQATRLISRELDHEDPVPGRYQLEVTSPGLERVLRTPGHFQGAIGADVKVRTHAHVEGERRVEGLLVAADEDGITITTTDDGDQRVAYPDIERARTVFVWASTPKPGKGAPRTAGTSAAPVTSTQGKAAS